MTSHIFCTYSKLEDFDFLCALVSVYDSKVQKFTKEVVLQKKDYFQYLFKKCFGK